MFDLMKPMGRLFVDDQTRAYDKKKQKAIKWQKDNPDTKPGILPKVGKPKGRIGSGRR